MTTYINNKKPKEICYHERTFKWCGWKTCVDCGLCLRRIFSQDLYSHLRGYAISRPKDRLPKIREIMDDMTYLIVRKGSTLNGVLYYHEPPEAGLPRELFDHTKELYRKCLDLEKNLKCHTRSLCAALLWNKVKSLYPSSMKLTEFSKRVGVSIPTIKKLMIDSKYIIKKPAGLQS